MYSFVKFIIYLIDEHEKESPTAAESGMHFHPEAASVIKEFSKRYGITYNKAQRIAADVKESGWILVDQKSSSKFYYCPNRKTRQIVEGVPYFRFGLINEWMKEFGSTFTVTIAVAALIVSILVAIFK